MNNAFKNELNLIKNDNIRKSGEYLVSKLPDYFYKISASSTGKYHPSYTLGEYGLYKHVKSAVRIARELLVLDMYKKIFTSDEQDIIILAIILHDGFKKGITEGKYTRFDHPLIMGNYIIENKDKLFLTDEQIEILSNAIKRHMGQWTTDFNGNEILESPKTKVDKFVHLCDYLASRKFLNVNFDENLQVID